MSTDIFKVAGLDALADDCAFGWILFTTTTLRANKDNDSEPVNWILSRGNGHDYKQNRDWDGFKEGLWQGNHTSACKPCFDLCSFKSGLKHAVYTCAEAYMTNLIGQKRVLECNAGLHTLTLLEKHVSSTEVSNEALAAHSACCRHCMHSI